MRFILQCFCATFDGEILSIPFQQQNTLAFSIPQMWMIKTEEKMPTPTKEKKNIQLIRFKYFDPFSQHWMNSKEYFNRQFTAF